MERESCLFQVQEPRFPLQRNKEKEKEKNILQELMLRYKEEEEENNMLERKLLLRFQERGHCHKGKEQSIVVRENRIGFDQELEQMKFHMSL